jgi:DNA-binding CsgD family transcriptional regulator
MVGMTVPGGVRCLSVVGRSAELAAIGGLLDAIRAGAGGVLMFDGDAGLGKSRLVRAASDRAREAGMRVAVGRASESAAVPYRALSEALATAGRGGPPDDPLVAPYRTVLGRLVPGWPCEAEPADSSVVAVGEAVLAVAAASGGGNGLLMVLEDLHWADAETLAVVEYVADNVGGRAGWLLTARPAPAAASRLGRELDLRESLSRVVLAPLDAAQAAEMAAGCMTAAGRDLPDDDVADVVARSGGLPLLIEDLLASRLASPATAAGLGGTVSERFRDVVVQRLGGLGGDARQVVRAAAVLGTRFDWRLLGPITGLTSAEVGAAIDTAVYAQLLIIDGPVRVPVFRHALTAEIVAAEIDTPARVMLELRAADAVARAGGEADESLALEARLRRDAGDDARAGGLLVRLAERAVRVGALGMAEQHLRAALSLAAGGVQASLLLLEVLVHSGQPEPAVRLGEELLGRIDLAGDGRAAAELLVARACLAAGKPEEAGRHLRGAGRTASGRRRAEIASVEAHMTLASVSPDRLVAAEHLAHRAIAEAEAAGAPELACESLEVAGRCARLRDLGRAEEAFGRALVVAEDNGLAVWRIRALNELGTIEMFRDVEPAGLLEARSAALAAGALATVAGVEVNLAAVHTMRAEFALGRAAAESCEAIARRCGLPQLRAAGIVFQGVIAAHQGRFGDMRTHVRAAERLAGEDPDVIVGTWAMCRGTAALLREERDQAWHAFATAADAVAARPALAINPVAGPWLLLRAGAGQASLAEVDDFAAAQPLGARWSALWEGLSRGIALGRLGDAESAAVAARQAVAAGDRMPLFCAMGLRLAGERALADGWGDPDAWLSDAARAFSRFGHVRAAAACRDLLRRSGRRTSRPRAVDAVVPAELRRLRVTAREFQVLQLAARRCTNSEIAARLYLSPRTVEKHIACLLAKTGARNRRELELHAAGDPSAEDGG